MAEHNTLTGTSLHEPKGIAALNGGASDSGKAYLSDGAASGSWQLPVFSAEEAELSLGVTTNNAVATTIVALDIYYPISGTWVEEHKHGAISTTPATGTFNVVVDGDYKLISSFSVIASQSLRVWNVSVLVNGVQTGNVRIRRKIATGADVGAMALTSTLTNLVIGDTVQLGVAAITGDTPATAGQTFTVENASMGLTLIGVN